MNHGSSLPGAPAPPRPVDDSYWVDPGRLLAGAYPGARSRTQAMHRLGRFLEAGVSCFVDLTEPGELRAYDSLLPASPQSGGRRVEYHRLPIVDHGVPPDRETMARILEVLDEALDAGHVVYLHCRAGVGRSAMTAACWLAERAGSGERGLAELAAAWPQASQSQHWPCVPETEEQERFARQWPGRAARGGAPRAGAGPTTVERRLHGAWLGLALGDALGASRAAGTDVATGALAWTQHTALALCSADSLLTAGRFDARDQILRFVRWQKEGYRTSTGAPSEARVTADVAKALATFLWRGLPMAGSHDPADVAPTSLPRMVAAAAFACGDAHDAVELGVECSRITHQSPSILDACRVYTAMLVGALRGEPVDDWLARLPAAAAAAFASRRVPAPVSAVFSATDGQAVAAAPGRAGATQVLGEVRRIVASDGDFLAVVEAAAARGGRQEAALYGALAGALYGAQRGADELPGDLCRRLAGLAQVTQVAGLCSARARDRAVSA